MAPSPFRRRKAAKTARNLALAEAALALAKDRALAGRSAKRGRSGKLLLLGGAVAAAAAALLKRDKVAGLLPSRSRRGRRAAAPRLRRSRPTTTRPARSRTPRRRCPRPTRTSRRGDRRGAPRRPPRRRGRRDRRSASDYAGSAPASRRDEAPRPLAEAGEGESEGQEQAEADLAENALPRRPERRRAPDRGRDPRRRTSRRGRDARAAASRSTRSRRRAARRPAARAPGGGGPSRRELARAGAAAQPAADRQQRRRGAPRSRRRRHDGLTLAAWSGRAVESVAGACGSASRSRSSATGASPATTPAAGSPPHLRWSLEALTAVIDPCERRRIRRSG